MFIFLYYSIIFSFLNLFFSSHFPPPFCFILNFIFLPQLYTFLFYLVLFCCNTIFLLFLVLAFGFLCIFIFILSIIIWSCFNNIVFHFFRINLLFLQSYLLLLHLFFFSMFFHSVLIYAHCSSINQFILLTRFLFPSFVSCYLFFPFFTISSGPFSYILNMFSGLIFFSVFNATFCLNLIFHLF